MDTGYTTRTGTRVHVYRTRVGTQCTRHSSTSTCTSTPVPCTTGTVTCTSTGRLSHVKAVAEVIVHGASIGLAGEWAIGMVLVLTYRYIGSGHETCCNTCFTAPYR